MSIEESARAEVRVKAVACAEAVYRLSAANGFDDALAKILRMRATDVLSLAAGLSLRSGFRRRRAAEELGASAAAVRELIRFAEQRGWILPAYADRVVVAYQRLAECARRTADTSEAADTGMRADGGSPARQRQILEYLSDHGRAQIGDLRALFGDACSEKTLQRDLWQLATSGIIKKRGDNRWTTYVLIGHEMSDT